MPFIVQLIDKDGNSQYIQYGPMTKSLANASRFTNVKAAKNTIEYYRGCGNPFWNSEINSMKKEARRYASHDIFIWEESAAALPSEALERVQESDNLIIADGKILQRIYCSLNPSTRLGEIFYRGFEAANSRVRWFNNPYPSGSIESYQWDQGHSLYRLTNGRFDT